jgi:hypothetical protein
MLFSPLIGLSVGLSVIIIGIFFLHMRPQTVLTTGFILACFVSFFLILSFGELQSTDGKVAFTIIAGILGEVFHIGALQNRGIPFAGGIITGVIGAVYSFFIYQ